MRALRWASNAWTIVLLLTVLLSALMVGGRFVVPLVAEPPALLAAAPPDGAGDVPLRTRPILRFTTPMNPRTVERALRIDPALQARLEWNESFTTLTISPTVLLRNGWNSREVTVAAKIRLETWTFSSSRATSRP